MNPRLIANAALGAETRWISAAPPPGTSDKRVGRLDDLAPHVGDRDRAI